MRQFDVLRNPDPETTSWAPYVVVLQSNLLHDLATVVVAPLVDPGEFGPPATTLNPVFAIESRRVVLSTAELAGVSRRELGERVASLKAERDAIVAALDLLFTGI